MKESNDFTSQTLGSPFLQGSFNMTVFNDGSPTGIVLNGDKIQHQFRIGVHTLLITHYDYFDGVDYCFYFLSNDLKILDVVSTPNYFGFIDNIKIFDDEKITFGFYGTEDSWLLSCLPNGTWSFKFSDFNRRHPEKLFAKRYLSLQLL